MAKVRSPLSSSENKNGSLGNIFTKKIVSITGSNQDITHSFNEDEKEQFILHINNTLKGDIVVQNKLPIDVANMELFEKCQGMIVR
jgi:hypothetical protein